MRADVASVLVVFGLGIPASGASQDVERPRLVVVITIDSLSPMQIARVDDLLVGGLSRLATEGAWFRHCHNDHAITMTAPGHFALTSGRQPGPAGVVANWWFEPSRGRWIYCVEDSASELTGVTAAGDGGGDVRAGRSYRNVGASSLGDWLKAEYPRSRVFAVSRKDRTAVLLGGRAADGAYWYDDATGAFVSSTFYGETPHEWVTSYNARRRADDFRGARWERLLADTAIYFERAREDSFPGEEDISSSGRDEPRRSPAFDHRVVSGAGLPDSTFYRTLGGFPFADVMTMELAFEALAAEGLGSDDEPDLLLIGLSALDTVAHETGPLSQEAIDVLLRADRLLGKLFDRLDHAVGPHYVVALASDHGMLPLPEYVEQGHRDLIGGARGRRVEEEARRFRERLDVELAALTGGSSPIAAVSSQGGVWMDRELAGRHGVSLGAIEERLRALAEAEPWIARVFSRAELLVSGDDDDPIVRRYRHSTHPSSSPDFFVCLAPGVLLKSTGSTHGTPYDYDTHVPLVIWGPGVRSGMFPDAVRTIDLAPTLARLLGLEKVPPVDGRVLVEALRSAYH